MKEKIKTNDYIQIGIMLFIVIVASILVYFIFLRMNYILDLISRLIKILMPIILGGIFAYILNPIVDFNEKRILTSVKDKKIARRISIFLTYLTTIIILLFFIRFGIPSLLDSLQLMINNLPNYLNNIYNYLTSTMKNNEGLYSMLQTFNTNINDYINNIISPSIDKIMINITTGITSFVKIIINCIMGLIVSIYLIYDKEEFIRKFKKLLYALLPRSIYENTVELLSYTDKILGGFMIAKIIDSAIIGFLTFIILYIFNIPYGLIISLIVGITNIIPYFGPIIGAVPSTILLFLIKPSKAITFLIIIILIQQFDGNVLGPKLIENKTGIKSFWVLFAILLFGGIFGFIGMIFGVPVFAIIYSLISSYINKKLAKEKLQ